MMVKHTTCTCKPLPSIVTTNGSFHRTSAVLSQKQRDWGAGGAEHVVVYASPGLRHSEKNNKNYSDFKLELLALQWAVSEKLKDYLIYSKFMVDTTILSDT
ncbi:unnamed protein product [Caretta caretta]